jgi:outer membrane protein assembly factor BamD (BamD/ComL family)
MAMKAKILLIIAFSFLLFSLKPACAQSAGEKYKSGLEAVKNGNEDYAYLYFLSIARDNPGSKYRPLALFACGEYYFYKSDYEDAFNTFSEFIEDYPDSRIKPYAVFFLLKIARSWQKGELVKTIEKEIRDMKQVILVFKETKEYRYKYRSLLGRKYKLVYHIDRVEFNADGEILEQVFY